MHCVPIAVRTIVEDVMQSTKLVQAWLFLERNGAALLETEGADAALQFAAENGIPLSGPPLPVGEFLFLPCDATDEELRNFYTWGETAPNQIPSREVWRPFLWTEGGDWGTNSMLNTISLDVAGGAQPTTVGAVLRAYFYTKV